ncbi:MAG: imidazole glycerol phosphate synthase subunit HisH [Thermodesulfovibrionia bacterium]|nr:imidazole glycerol phosphate synthase subunit HisH [Thermodesulfovibrionia bacterium]
MIAIVDYGMGNLRSVEKGFLKVGVNAKITNRPEVIEKADAIVLPGVGAFKDCMRELTSLELTDAIVGAIKKGKPYLGICLGLQVLFSESEEFGKCRGLDIFRGKVVRFSSGNLKIPHMGWNELTIQKQNPLLNGIKDKTYFYFVHSFYVAPEDSSIIAATTDYGLNFTSMVWEDNIFAVQFHPEKSQAAGLRLLENFGRIVKSR